MRVPPPDRFHAVAGNYARYRPGYPDAVLDRILDVAALHPPRPDALVVDLGCGTGISSRAFAARGIRVIGVDPNSSMLAEARAAGGGPEYLQGAAEATGLPAACADLVIAAQAFHWFDRDRAAAEIRRLLRPGGRTAAFWNVRPAETPFLRDYETLLLRYCTAPGERVRDEEALAGLRALPGLRDRVDLHHERVEDLDRESCLGRVRSASYVAHGVDDREGFERDLGRLFDAHARGGRVPWALRTVGSCFRLD